MPVKAIETAPAISAGINHSLALMEDGTVWAWGSNNYGQLGDGTTTSKTTPLQVKIYPIVAVSAGYSYSLALKSDGTVWAWGNNTFGQLGDGETTSKTTPVQVLGLSSVVAVSAGYFHSLALKSDGTVWAWGNNRFGQLGDGETTSKTTLTQVHISHSVVAVSAGLSHSLALENNGDVWAWGDNSLGQLGDGTKTSKTTPVLVSDLSGVITISTRESHSLAVKGDGTIWAWGDNHYGQLGDGTTTSKTTPVQVLGLSSVVAVSAGTFYSLVMRRDGTAKAWGKNDYGQLGVGGTSSYYLPVTSFTQYVAHIKLTIKDNGGNSIDGVIVDSVSQPAGLIGLYGETAADGTVLFIGLIGSYTIKASKAGYVPVFASINVTAGAIVETIITLQLLSTIKVTVKDAAGNLLGGVAVSSTAQPSGQAEVSGTTAAGGTVQFKVAGGIYTMQASKTGYIATSTTISVAAASTTEATITLQPMILRVTVKGVSGNTLSGITVTSTSQPSGQAAVSGKTAADGSVLFSPVAAGSYTIKASEVSYFDGIATVNVAATGTTEATITLLAKSAIRVAVKDAAGNYLSGAAVSSAITPSGQAAFSGTTAADGTVEFNPIVVGGYAIKASKAGYLDGSITVNTPPGTITVVYITLQTAPTVIVVTVKDTGGNILSGASVSSTTQPSGQAALSGTTDIKGGVTFTGVLPGSYVFKASKTGYASTSSSFTIDKGTTKMVTITLAPNPTTLQIGVKSSSGKLVASAKVTITMKPISKTVYTSTLGVTSILEVGAGTYSVEVSKSGYVTWSGSVEVVAKTANTFSVTLTPSLLSLAWFGIEEGDEGRYQVALIVLGAIFATGIIWVVWQRRHH